VLLVLVSHFPVSYNKKNIFLIDSIIRNIILTGLQAPKVFGQASVLGFVDELYKSSKVNAS